MLPLKLYLDGLSFTNLALEVFKFDQHILKAWIETIMMQNTEQMQKWNIKHQWSSGRIVPCHGTDPGSIPGWCTHESYDENVCGG